MPCVCNVAGPGADVQRRGLGGRRCGQQRDDRDPQREPSQHFLRFFDGGVMQRTTTSGFLLRRIFVVSTLVLNPLLVVTISIFCPARYFLLKS